MDFLTASGLEPQLAIPVIVVVVGALLVYIFGFQKSEEPSLEHLAVLQSTSSYKARSVTNTKTKSSAGGVPNKPKEKPAQNGHIVHEKDRATAASKKKEVSVNNKENKPPRTTQNISQTTSKKAKQETTRPADFDSGDWIQAVSRKDKKKHVKKDEPKQAPSSPEKTEESRKPKTVESDHVDESVLKEAQVQIQNQTTQTTPKPSPEKKSKKGAKDASTTTASSAPSSQDASPVKQSSKENVPEKKVVEKKSAEKKSPEKKATEKQEVITVNGESGDFKENQESPAKKLSTSEDTPATGGESKGYVAFDEMGDNVDAWEEAKSRGNKKRRARKD